MSKKSLAVAQCLIDIAKAANRPTATPMKLLKLVYIAHGYMLGRHGKPMLEEPVMAYIYGPVVPSIYNAVRHYRSSPVPRIPGVTNVAVLGEDEIAIIEEVLRIYGGYCAATLSAAMHQEGSPWNQTWNIRGEPTPISNDLIRYFYAQALAAETHDTL
jgi:uncharacterized phage-associated protein